MATEQVQGLSQLLRNMEQLPREMVSKNGGLVRSALFVGVKRVRDRARELAPRDTGNMAKNIIAVRDSNPTRAGAAERYIITVRKKRWGRKALAKAVRKSNGKIDGRQNGDAFYWRFIEFGTKFIQARPFLRRAFEEDKRMAVEDFKRSLGGGIQRVVRKMAKLQGAPR